MGFEMTFKGDFEWEVLEEDLRENFEKNSKGSLRRYSDGKEMQLKREIGRNSCYGFVHSDTKP